MARTFIYKTIGLFEAKAKDTLAAIVQGEQLANYLKSLAVLCRYTPENTVALRREIAALVSAEGKYIS